MALSPHREIRLKTWPEPFQAVLLGRKSYEIRVNDRGFQVGDILELAEWKPDKEHPDWGWFTGREVRKRVVYMTPGGQWGLPSNLCVLGIEIVLPCPAFLVVPGRPSARCRLDDGHRGECDSTFRPAPSEQQERQR